MVVEDRRLDQLQLDEVAQHVVDEPLPRVGRARVDASLLEPLAQVVCVSRPEPSLLVEIVHELHTLPQHLRVDLHGRGT